MRVVRLRAITFSMETHVRKGLFQDVSHVPIQRVWATTLLFYRHLFQQHRRQRRTILRSGATEQQKFLGPPYVLPQRLT